MSRALHGALPIAAAGPAFGTADLTNCDREPIRLPGSVQPHGALLALTQGELRIVCAGGDTAGLLGAAPDALLGRKLAGLLAPAQVQRVQALLGAAPVSRPVHAFALPAPLTGGVSDALLHESSGRVVIEFDPQLQDPPADTLTLVQKMLLSVQRAGSIAAFCEAIAREVHAATGFHRVMTYRFRPDGCGAVEAEARDDAAQSFLGLHYPASDIPRQARELYFENWIRAIPDARYTPAPVLQAPGEDVALDLSHSVLRSVSPIHLEYLANMGVVGAMSLSIIVQGRLWGLIACHHPAPLRLPYRLRLVCELFAQMASAQLEMRIEAEELQARVRTQRLNEEMMGRMSAVADLAEGLTRYRPNLLDYVAAGGVGLWLDGRYTSLGRAPDEQQVAGLVGWLNEQPGNDVLHTDRLPLDYPPAAGYADLASGLLAISVSRVPRDYVLWFRPELVRTVTWAGDPHKPVEGEGERLSPRRSFAAWRQSVRLQSEPWRAVEITAAASLRTLLTEVVLQRIDQIAREREKARVKQDMLMAELDRQVDQWQAAARQLQVEATRRSVAEGELSQVLRRTVAEQEAERQRIARELHDSLGQTLTLLQLGFDGVARTLPDDAEAQRQLATLKDLTFDLGSEVNRLAWEIRPTALDDLGLQTAVRMLVEKWGASTPLQFDLHLALGERRLPPAIETTLYRVLQEAITNIVRHAGARRVGVVLQTQAHEAQLVVEDDGSGFEWPGDQLTAAPGRRLGLLGARERLALVGGTMEVDTAPGRGAALVVRVPL